VVNVTNTTEVFLEWYEDSLEQISGGANGETASQSLGGDTVTTLDGGTDEEELNNTQLVRDPRIVDINRSIDVPETGEQVEITTTLLEPKDDFQDLENFSADAYLRYYEDRRVNPLLLFVEQSLGLGDAEKVSMNESDKNPEREVSDLVGVEEDDNITDVMELQKYEHTMEGQSPGNETSYFVELEGGVEAIERKIDLSEEGIDVFGSFSEAASEINSVNDLFLISTDLFSLDFSNIHVPQYAGPERYFTFREVDDVAVVYAEYEDSGVGNSPQVSNKNELVKADILKEDKINRYMASWKGSWGTVGYDLDFYDNDGGWYEVGEFSKYSNSNEPRVEFRQDTLERLINDRPEGSLYELEGEKEERGTYNATVSIGPGGIGGANHQRKYDRIYIEENDKYPVWVHELGHSLGFGDLYGREAVSDGSTGQIGATGVMGGGHISQILSPFSSVTRTKYHSLRLSDGESRSNSPWLMVNNTSKETVNMLTIDSLEGLNYQDKVEVYSPPATNNIDNITGPDTLTGSGELEDVVYVLGARDTQRISGIGDGKLERGVYIYRVDIQPEEGTSPNKIYLLDQNTDVRNALYGQSTSINDPSLQPMGEGTPSVTNGTEIRIPTSYIYTVFDTADSRGSGESFEMDITISSIEQNNSRDDPRAVGSTINTNFEVEAADGKLPENFTPPDIRLQAYEAKIDWLVLTTLQMSM